MVQVAKKIDFSDPIDVGSKLSSCVVEMWSINVVQANCLRRFRSCRETQTSHMCHIMRSSLMQASCFLVQQGAI